MSKKKVALLSYNYEKSYIELEHESYRVAELFNGLQDEYVMEIVVWDKKTPEELKNMYELVFFKTIWDYHLPSKFRYFLQFLSKCEECSLNILNSPKIVRWNCVKSKYLRDFRDHSVDIIPTKVISGQTINVRFDNRPENYWRRIFEEFTPYSRDSIVVKPSVSASAFKTKVFVKSDCEERKYETIERFVKEIITDDCDVLIQPLMKEVQTFGELSLFYVGEKFTHSVLKIPKSGDFRSHFEHGGSIHVHDVNKSDTQGFKGTRLIKFGENVIQKVKEMVMTNDDEEENILFCRIDVIVRDKNDENIKTPKILLMEAELIEPSLYSYWYPEASKILCQEIMKRLKGK